MFVFVVIFLVAGIGLVLASMKARDKAAAAAGWPTTEGKLERCEAVERPGSIHDPDSTSTWYLDLAYSYTVGAKTYRSTQYSFGNSDNRSAGPFREIASALRAQQSLRVHYDPADPATAVLSPEAPSEMIEKLGFFALGLAGVSFLLWIVAG